MYIKVYMDKSKITHTVYFHLSGAFPVLVFTINSLLKAGLGLIGWWQRSHRMKAKLPHTRALVLLSHCT